MTFVRGPPGSTWTNIQFGGHLSTIQENELLRALSESRMSGYFRTTNGDLDATLRLYKWNIEIASAIFEILALVEVVLRNEIDRALRNYLVTLGDHRSWLSVPEFLLLEDSQREIAKAKVFVVKCGKRLSHDNLISTLNFGFWRSLLTKRYKDTLWRNALRFSFPNAPTGQPEYIFTRVRHLNILRNRIAHHEPIHRRDIARDFEICIEVLQAISPAIAQWSVENSRVLQVLAERP